MMLKNGLIVKWLTNLQTSVLYWRAASKEQGSKSRDQRAGIKEQGAGSIENVFDEIEPLVAQMSH